MNVLMVWGAGWFGEVFDGGCFTVWYWMKGGLRRGVGWRVVWCSMEGGLVLHGGWCGVG